MVSGCSGSGKSTLTRFLAQKRDLSAIHMDVHYWKPNWVETPEAEWRKTLTQLAGREHWVLDGSFPATMDISLPRAQVLIILDLPRWLCLFRAIKRIFIYSKSRRRPDMAEGCDEKVDFSFYRYIWTYRRTHLPMIELKIETHGQHLSVIRLHSRKEIGNFLEYLDGVGD